MVSSIILFVKASIKITFLQSLPSDGIGHFRTVSKSNPPREVVPSLENVLGPENRFFPTLSFLYSTDWFCKPSFFVVIKSPSINGALIFHNSTISLAYSLESRKESVNSRRLLCSVLLPTSSFGRAVVSNQR
jgi:hypothetical protein